jgi:ubiquinone/menaquinone biosynthesis C-methylase UbiE
MNNIKKKIQKYWNKQPCNVKHSNKKFLSKEYFNEVKKKRYFVEPHIKKFADFKKYKNKNVLEIGCGIGTDAMEFIKSGANYTGIEYSDKSIDVCKKRLSVLNLKNKKANFFLGDAESLSKHKYLKSQKFHLIYSFGVLHHTPNMIKCFDEIYKLCSNKTEIKIMLYAKNSYKNYMLNLTNYRYEAQKGVIIAYKVDDTFINKIIKKKIQDNFKRARLHFSLSNKIL